MCCVCALRLAAREKEEMSHTFKPVAAAVLALQWDGKFRYAVLFYFFVLIFFNNDIVHSQNNALFRSEKSVWVCVCVCVCALGVCMGCVCIYVILFSAWLIFNYLAPLYLKL